MRFSTTSFIALIAAAALSGPVMAQSAREKAYDAQISNTEMVDWMKRLAAEPSHVSSPASKGNAEWVRDQFKSWGWDAKIETFQVLYPTPLSVNLEMVGPTPFKATLTEPPVPGDASSSRTKDELPAYVAFQGDGDVTGDLVYVNFGMPDDYKALERMGVSVKGKIVIARYGVGWRGLKPKLAQDHGAIGCIIYSDPQQDGYGPDDVYPTGGGRPSQSFQRGSVADMPLYPGDPLTPGVGATEKAKRLKREDAQTILKIPVLPISYGDAQHFLSALSGNVVPESFVGGLPITYHVGGTDGVKVHLAVKSEWSLKTKGVISLNTDGNERGQFSAEGSHAYEHFVNQVIGDVQDPETGVPVAKRLRAFIQVEGAQNGASGRAVAAAKIVADADHDLPIGALGSGSDYSSFIGHLGLAAINFGFGGEGNSGGVYHSAYDTWEHHLAFDDPGLAYSGALAKVGGRLVMRIADSDLPVQRYGNFAETVATYSDEIKRLADGKREAQQIQARLSAGDLYKLADDPKRTNGQPTALAPVPYFNFAPLDNAISHLKKSAKAYDQALMAKGAALSPEAKVKLFEMQRSLEQALTNDIGLPGRPWYKNLVYAPGRFTGYGAKTLPGVREAIEEERWADADKYSGLTAQALETYASKLDDAAKLINGG